MAMTKASGHEPSGFGGEIAGFSLADVVQLNVQNRFSGCITVQSLSGTGRIFLRDSAIVHAEANDRTGEQAFCEILSWEEGRFALQGNVTAARATIHKSWQLLLLDAYRLMDERRAGRPTPPPVEDRGADLNVLEKLKRIPGVVEAVAERTDGERTEHETYAAEALAGQGQYLTAVATQLGTVLGCSGLRSVTLQAGGRHVVLLRGRSYVLTVAVACEQDPGGVEAEIRSLLGLSR